MLIRPGTLVVAMLFGLPLASVAQVEHRVDSHGSDVVVTEWSPESTPQASILLVPGWGGGPSDVLGIAEELSTKGVEVFVLSPRGWHESEGHASFSNALEDIGAVLPWVRKRASHPVVLGGHSFGGGMVLAYAARDTSVKALVSVAGTDHGQLIRKYLSEPEFAAGLNAGLESMAAEGRPIRFEVQTLQQELIDGQTTLGLRENASRLADRSILMFGGWEDINTTVDDYLLPLYRALRSAGATDVTFSVFHTDHGFGNVRPELHTEVRDWLTR